MNCFESLATKTNSTNVLYNSTGSINKKTIFSPQIITSKFNLLTRQDNPEQTIYRNWDEKRIQAANKTRCVNMIEVNLVKKIRT